MVVFVMNDDCVMVGVLVLVFNGLLLGDVEFEFLCCFVYD